MAIDRQIDEAGVGAAADTVPATYLVAAIDGHDGIGDHFGILHHLGRNRHASLIEPVVDLGERGAVLGLDVGTPRKE